MNKVGQEDVAVSSAARMQAPPKQDWEGSGNGTGPGSSLQAALPHARYSHTQEEVCHVRLAVGSVNA